MKTFVLILASLVSLSSVASDERLYFIDVPHSKTPLPLTGNTAYIGGYEMCYVGNGWAAKATLWNNIKDDIEKASPYARFDQNNGVIYYGYVDTKCTDEGASDNECRVAKRVNVCRF